MPRIFPRAIYFRLVGGKVTELMNRPPSSRPLKHLTLESLGPFHYQFSFQS